MLQWIRSLLFTSLLALTTLAFGVVILATAWLPLTLEQRELCLQAMIAWEARHLGSEQRTGFIDCGSKTRGEVCATPAEEEPDLIRIVRASGLGG